MRVAYNHVGRTSLRDELSWDEQGRNPAKNMAASMGIFQKANKNIVPLLMRRNNEGFPLTENMMILRKCI